MNLLKAYYLFGITVLSLGALWLVVMFLAGCTDIGEYPGTAQGYLYHIEPK